MANNKASEFLERNSENGKLHVGKAVLELWARQQNILDMLEEIREGIGGYAAYMEKMDERLKKLEPTIQVFGVNEGTSFLGDLNKTKGF